jgi:hypothetical protein
MMLLVDMVVTTMVIMTVVIALVVGAMTVIIPILIGTQHWLFEFVDRKLNSSK